MTDFMTRLPQMLSTPWVPWIILGVIVVGVLLGQVQKTGPSKPLRFSETGWLNALGWFSVLFSPVLILLFLSVLFMLGQVGWKILTGDTIREGSDNLRWYVLSFVGLLTALGGIIGTPLALLRVWTTERQTKTAEQGHITDRINKAVEGLGATKQVRRQRRNKKGDLLYEDNAENKPDFKKPIIEDVTEPNIEVRVGAIFALERIAQDSLRDHVRIMEILCSYMLENSPGKSAVNLARPDNPNYVGNDKNVEIPRLRTDIQVALTVIGRRTQQQRKYELKSGKGTISLSDCNFQNFAGTELNFSGLDFSHSWLGSAIFTRCDFTECKFKNATLELGAMIECNLKDVDARAAVFDKRGFPGTSFEGANLFRASFNRAEIRENAYHGLKTDFSYANITDTQFGGVAEAETIMHIDRVFDANDAKHGSWAHHKDQPFYEFDTTQVWGDWKKSLGYTFKKYKQ
ncbi:pentapeptide repeat-containing protein [Celeribacter baekdonensis]|uniref:pentapeptide repeat-containing protein n=1 Tax=Celeribacter baekdonensis TaxID=875171 RepID=UPI0030D7699E|tara:strand:+ start:48018 stop:49394 length:1377 start_codon:yes stop_codon:yes gene_type:complete